MKKVVLIALAASCIAGAAQAASVKVLVIGTHTNSPLAEVVGQLNDDTYFDFDATGADHSTISSAADLQAFDAVVFGNSGSGSQGFGNTTLWSALQGYYDAGGSIVASGWLGYGYVVSSATAGQIDTLLPVNFAASGYTFTSSGTNTPTTAHAITDGLTSWGVGSNYQDTYSVLDTGATVLAQISGNASVVVDENSNGGRAVVLGNGFMQSSGYGTTALRSGVYDQLFEQSVNWAANGTSELTPVPLPAGLPLMLAGMGAFAVMRRRKKMQKV